MKLVSIVGLVLTLSLSNEGFVYARIVTVDPEHVHIPDGFDDNDNVEIILTGSLKNTCLSKPFGKAKIKGNSILIELKANKTDNKNRVCIQSLAPYLLTIPLGSLVEGHYQVSINRGQPSEQSSHLFVASHNSDEIDDFIYANVTGVKKLTSKPAIAIEGAHRSSCMEISRMEILPNQRGDTIAILPIIEQVNKICDQTIKPFVEEIALPQNLPRDVVFHVRRTDGTAINIQW